MIIFVDFYRYDHGKKRHLLKRMFKDGLVTRDKRWYGYLYTIPDTSILTDKMRRILCIEKVVQPVSTE